MRGMRGRERVVSAFLRCYRTLRKAGVGRIAFTQAGPVWRTE